eukprot:809212-Lingulodinium_polyedra.AAC.1
MSIGQFQASMELPRLRHPTCARGSPTTLPGVGQRHGGDVARHRRNEASEVGRHFSRRRLGVERLGLGT